MRRFALLCLALTGAATAAPVPRQASPPRLTAESLHGTWDFQWGGMRGEIAFAPDGTYTAYLGECGYGGEWTFEGGSVTLAEGAPDCHGVLPEHRTRYTLALTPAGGAVRGTSGGVEVTLSLRRVKAQHEDCYSGQP